MARPAAEGWAITLKGHKEVEGEYKVHPLTAFYVVCTCLCGNISARWMLNISFL